MPPVFPPSDSQRSSSASEQYFQISLRHAFFFYDRYVDVFSPPLVSSCSRQPVSSSPSMSSVVDGYFSDDKIFSSRHTPFRPARRHFFDIAMPHARLRSSIFSPADFLLAPAIPPKRIDCREAPLSSTDSRHFFFAEPFPLSFFYSRLPDIAARHVRAAMR